DPPKASKQVALQTKVRSRGLSSFDTRSSHQRHWTTVSSAQIVYHSYRSLSHRNLNPRHYTDPRPRRKGATKQLLDPGARAPGWSYSKFSARVGSTAAARRAGR